MPSAEQLTLYQAQRRSMVVTALAEAGWQYDSVLWDAGVETDFVATMSSRRAGGLLRCDYVIVGVGVDPREYLSLRSDLADQQVRLVVDFLGQTGGGPDRLAEVLAALVAAQAGRTEDPFGVESLARICPVFFVGEQGELVPVGTAGQERSVGPDSNPEPDEEVSYADEVEEQLFRELVPAGWRRSPDESILHGLLETFYVDSGSVRLSVGRCNGEETLVRITTGDTSTHLRVDGVYRPEHTDRLVALLRRWQDQVTAESWPQLVDDLSAGYAAVHVEDDRGNWQRIHRSDPVRPASPPTGVDRRAELVESLFVRSGWTTVVGADQGAVSVCVRNRHGVTLRVDHVVNGFGELPEALALSVRLADGTGGPFGGAVSLALDVFDLRSGHGDRDRTQSVVDTILARYDALDAETLPTLVQALRLCCPVLLVGVDGSLCALPAGTGPAAVQELPLPTPRPRDEVDRLLVAGVGQPAELWFERGLAALADDRPDLALDSFDRSIQADPAFGPAHLQRALLIGPTDVAEAARGLLRCAELGYAPGLVLTRYGRLLFRDGHFQDGLAIFRHLTDKLPEYGSGWYERAVAALQEGLYDESVAAATAAVQLLPDNASALYVRARGYARSGQTEHALADIARALDLDGSLRWAIATDQDLYSLRGDDRFVTLVNPWPSPGWDGDGMDERLVETLR
ncbi:MAG TPA: tetratricopeptide repeat protein, partial [Mycobacteriales bacterium]